MTGDDEGTAPGLAPPGSMGGLLEQLSRLSDELEAFTDRLESLGQELSSDEVGALSDDLARGLCLGAGPSERCRLGARSGAALTGDLDLCPACRAPNEDAPRSLRRFVAAVQRTVQLLLDSNRRLGRRASRDSLTGAHNRAFFDEAIELEVARATRNQGRIMFVMVDIDRFKEINDTHGHARGDAVLAEVARRLRENVRASDFVVRYGGDEFLIVAPRVDEEACLPVLSRLMGARYRLHGEELDLSVGCSTWCPGGDVQAAIALADERMYEHKRTKRFVDDGATCLSVD